MFVYKLHMAVAPIPLRVVALWLFLVQEIREKCSIGTEIVAMGNKEKGNVFKIFAEGFEISFEYLDSFLFISMLFVWKEGFCK